MVVAQNPVQRLQHRHGDLLPARRGGQGLLHGLRHLVHQGLGLVLHVKNLPDVQNILILMLHGALGRRPGVLGHIGAHPLLVPAVHVPQLLLAEGGVPGEDEVGLQKRHGLLVGGEDAPIIVHLRKALLPLLLHLVVQAVGGDDVVLQP